jgi:adenylosuccinate synthase
MNRAYLLVDLAFGDSGKGSLTDWLTRTEEIKTVVRYNGGAQAAHNVVSPDGRHHTFAQFSSGTLAGARTHLSRFMMVDPLALANEANALLQLGVSQPLSLVSIEEEALVTTPYHQILNRLREISRGEERHGSCGVGVGETMASYLEHGEQVPLVRDFEQKAVLRQKLKWLREQKLEAAHALDLPDTDEVRQELEALEDNQLLEQVVSLCADLSRRVTVVDRSYLAALLESGPTIFEGAQGVLLDERFGFHPYTTWSNTTADNALTLLEENGFDGELTKVGLLRGYFTRHGAGPFPSEDRSIQHEVWELHNGRGRWQGDFRQGYFDLVLARYALAAVGGVDLLAFSCLDQMSWRKGPWPVATSYGEDVSGLYEQGRLVLGARHDREHQAALTAVLEQAEPHYQQIPQDVYLHFLASELGVPIGVVSKSANAIAKRVTREWAEKPSSSLSRREDDLSGVPEEIYRRLERLLRPDAVPRWLQSPLPSLAGRRPLDLLASGGALAVEHVISELESPGAV